MAAPIMTVATVLPRHTRTLRLPLCLFLIQAPVALHPALCKIILLRDAIANDDGSPRSGSRPPLRTYTTEDVKARLASRHPDIHNVTREAEKTFGWESSLLTTAQVGS